MPLSEETKQRIVAEFPKYPEKRAVLLTALHFVQEECGGWVPQDAVVEVAELLELPAIDVLEVVHFYSMYNAEKVGRFHLRVCTNLSCCLRGARGVCASLEEALDIRPGELTEDEQFSIEEVQCLGSCGTAPVIQVNNEAYRENVTADDMKALVAELRERAASEDAAADDDAGAAPAGESAPAPEGA